MCGFTALVCFVVLRLLLIQRLHVISCGFLGAVCQTLLHYVLLFFQLRVSLEPFLLFALAVDRGHLI